MGSGLLLASLIREPWQLYLSLGALVGGGVNLLAYTVQSLYLTSWFVRRRGLALSIALLLVSLLAVVLLAKKFSLVVDAGTALLGAPPSFAGVLVALLILLPESVAAITAARGNDLQKSVNLALGSSLATIGLTIPAVAAAAYALDKQLVLGLNAQEMVLLLLTFMLSMLTFGTGRTNILFGLVHMVVFAVFVFMQFVP